MSLGILHGTQCLYSLWKSNSMSHFKESSPAFILVEDPSDQTRSISVLVLWKSTVWGVRCGKWGPFCIQQLHTFVWYAHVLPWSSRLSPRAHCGPDIGVQQCADGCIKMWRFTSPCTLWRKSTTQLLESRSSGISNGIFLEDGTEACPDVWMHMQ